MSHISLPLPMVNYLESVFELTVFDVLAKVAVARSRSRRPRAAFVGFDPHLLGNLEAVHDSLIDFSNPTEAQPCSDSSADWRLTFNCFEGRPDDKDRPSRPLGQLNPAEFDLILVSEIDPARGTAFLTQLKTILASRAGNQPLVVSFGKLRDSFQGAMMGLRPDAYFTCLNARKTTTVAITLWLAAAAATGCVVECGTFLGGTSILMSLLLRAAGDPRRVHTFDTFEGLPKATGPDGKTIFEGATFTETTLSKVTQYVSAHNLASSLFPHKGLIQVELPKLWNQEKEVAFCFADTDQHAGTAATLETVLPRLHPRGLILVDDYFEHGVQRAVAESMTVYPNLRGGLVTHSMYLLWNGEN